MNKEVIIDVIAEEQNQTEFNASKYRILQKAMLREGRLYDQFEKIEALDFIEEKLASYHGGKHPANLFEGVN